MQVPGLPQLKGGLEFASDNQRTPYDVDPYNFGPRVGLAYQAPGGIVIRTGYGIFYEVIKGAAAGTGGGGFTGFNFTTPLTLTYQNNGATPWGRISNPLPDRTACCRPGSSQGLLTGVGSRRQRTDPHLEQHAVHADLELRNPKGVQGQHPRRH